MTEESCAASNQIIENVRKKKEKEREARRNYKHRSRQQANRTQPGSQHSLTEPRQAEGRAPEADMGPHGADYEPTGADEPVRSDL